MDVRNHSEQYTVGYDGKPKNEPEPQKYTNSTYFKELSYVLHAIIVACIVVVWAVRTASRCTRSTGPSPTSN